MRASKQTLQIHALVALLLLATGLAACGNGKPDRSSLLSPNRANELRSTLDDVGQMVDNGDCQGAANTALSFEQKVSALPGRLDAGLRDALVSGASRLQRLVQEQCEPAGTTGPTLQAPEESDEDGPGKNGKGKAKGHKKSKHEEVPEEGTTAPAVPDQNLGITTP
jgi:hypothetical protein